MASNGPIGEVKDLLQAAGNGGQADILARSSIFRFVPEVQRARLNGLFKRAQFEFGDLIIKKGEPADAFFIIVSGRAHVLGMSESGQEL